MAASFYDQPILNSSYHPPARHHALDEAGQPLDLPPIDGRRRSKLITPVPRAKKTKKAQQKELGRQDAQGLSTAEQKYNPTPIIDEIRGAVEAWRAISNPKNWGVTRPPPACCGIARTTTSAMSFPARLQPFSISRSDAAQLTLCPTKPPLLPQRFLKRDSVDSRWL